MPDWKPEIRRRLASLKLAPTREAAIVEELVAHLEDYYAELLACGGTRAEAERRTLAELSSSELLARELRRVERQVAPEPIVLGTNRRSKMIADLWQDLRFGARMLLKQPGFTLIAVLTLALGIGANTAIFSIVNAVLLRPFPYQAPERLVFVQERVSGGTGFSPSYPNFADWRTQNTAFDSIAAVRANESFNFTGAGDPERLQGRLVSAEFFSTLGIKPLPGRDFLAEEDRAGATPAVILSYGFWQRRFGADESIIGKQLTLNNQSLLTMQVSVNNPDGYQVANFFEQLQQEVRSVPGVKSVAVSNGLPFDVANFPTFIIEGRPEQENKPSGIRYTVSPDYFQTLGIELIKGRVFTAQDTRDSPRVIVIDEVLAREYFPNEDPLGKRLKQSMDSPGLEIVGVVRHVEPRSLDGQAPAPAQFYTNFNQISLQGLPGYVRRINLLTRTEVEPLSLVSAVRGQVAALNKDQAVFNVRTMEQIVGQSVAPRRFSMLLLTVFGVVALALASIGIYGMMSYAVAQRTREIGVRMALGAQSGNVLRLVIGRGMKLALAGVAIGLVASVALTRLMKTLLFGVSATDPLTFGLIALLLSLVALLACYLPARRATKVDPLVALRCE